MRERETDNEKQRETYRVRELIDIEKKEKERERNILKIQRSFQLINQLLIKKDSKQSQPEYSFKYLI